MGHQRNWWGPNSEVNVPRDHKHQTKDGSQNLTVDLVIGHQPPGDLSHSCVTEEKFDLVLEKHAEGDSIKSYPTKPTPITWKKSFSHHQ